MEMRKMKAVIVKHDDKIQKLEARLAAGPAQLPVPPAADLAPDEV